MKEEDKIIVKWVQEDVETSNNLLNNNNNNNNKFEKLVHLVGFIIRTYHPHVPTVLKSGSLKPWNPQGCHRAVQACTGIAVAL